MVAVGFQTATCISGFCPPWLKILPQLHGHMTPMPRNTSFDCHFYAVDTTSQILLSSSSTAERYTGRRFYRHTSPLHALSRRILLCRLAALVFSWLCFRLSEHIDCVMCLYKTLGAALPLQCRGSLSPLMELRQFKLGKVTAVVV